MLIMLYFCAGKYIYFWLIDWLIDCEVVLQKQKNNESFDLKVAKALPRLFAFTTSIPVTITVLLEITVPASCQPKMTCFVVLSNLSDKRFGWPFLLKVWLSPLFFNNVFHKFIDVCLKVIFGYCLENFLNFSIFSIWPKAYLSASIRKWFDMLLYNYNFNYNL